MRRISLSLILLAVLSGTGLRAEDEPKPLWGITAECQMVIVPATLAIQVIPELSEDATIDKAWEKLKAQIVGGEVKISAQIILKTIVGQKGVSHAGEELRYPTEFSPPDLPNNILNETSAEKVQEVLKHWPLVGFTPTTFETRDLGAILEFQSSSDDGRNFRVQGQLKHTRFLRFAKYDAGVIASGEHLTIDQPIFHSCTSTLDLNLRSGQRVLIGTHTLPGEEGVELFLMRVTAQLNAKVP